MYVLLHKYKMFLNYLVYNICVHINWEILEELKIYKISYIKKKDDAPQRGRRHNESSVSGGSSAVALRPLHKLLNLFSDIINVYQ